MTARTKRRRRGYSAGDMGPEPRPGLPGLEDRSRTDRVAGGRPQAEQVARTPRLGPGEQAGGRSRRRPRRGHVPDVVEAEPTPLTLKTLFDIYCDEVTPTKGERSQQYDEAAMKMFLGFFGEGRKPATLSQRDWDRFIRFIRARRAGSVGLNG